MQELVELMEWNLESGKPAPVAVSVSIREIPDFVTGVLSCVFIRSSSSSSALFLRRIIKK